MFNSENRTGLVFTAVESKEEAFNELEALAENLQSAIEYLISDTSISTLEVTSRAMALHESWKDIAYYLDEVLPMLDSLPDYPDYDE